MSLLKVMIVEDHPLMRAGIKKVLDKCEDIRVVGEAPTGEQAMELVDSTMPDVVLMDVRLPDSDGITTMRTIKHTHGGTKVLMYSGFDDEQYVVKALESGANGYLLKNAGAKELADAIRQTADGLSPISPQLMSKVIPMTRYKPRSCDRLTPREKEVWRLLSKGASNAEISKELFVSESTVKFHIRNIFHKLGVKNRVEAARVAYDSTVD